jgi:hypothetical protein
MGPRTVPGLSYQLLTSRNCTCQLTHPATQVKVKVKVLLGPTVSRLVCLGVEPHLGPKTTYILFVDSYCLVLWGALSDERTGLSLFICCWPSLPQCFSGPSPLGLVTIFYCLRFETSLFVASYDSQGYGGGIRNRLHKDMTQPSESESESESHYD